MAARRIQLSGGDSEVQAAVAAVRRGSVVVIPTETVYGFAISPRLPEAHQAVNAIKGRVEGQALTHHLAGREGLEALAPSPPRRVERLLERFWPGPLTVVLEGNHAATVGLRVPAHGFPQRVIRALGHSLLMTSVNRSGEPPLCDGSVILRAFGGAIDLLFDGGPSPLKMPSSVVRCTGPVLEVLREGILSREEIYVTAAQTILFVCSGNTCRSPMATAIARRRLSEALGVAEDRLLARGLHLVSAGTSTMEGLPASSGCKQTLEQLGMDASAHRSKALDLELVRRAAHIFCLASSHRQRLLELAPELGAKIELLRPDGQDIGDPFGGDLGTYEEVRNQIAAALDGRLEELVALVR
jgi:tRNA threonylcarbamoyl adenosine modification protein (Sua5/YciO/YrdC/YwlC family)